MKQSRIVIGALSILTAVTLVGCTATFTDSKPSEPTLNTADFTVTPTITETPEPKPVPEGYIKDDGTLVAYNFEQAEALCEEAYAEDALSDCLNSAIGTWCEYEPLTPDNEHFTEEDARCLAEQEGWN